MFAGKHVIGIVGGIGSGKSYVARLFGELGCAVIDSDKQVRAAYEDTSVRDILRRWWGDQVFRPEGSVDRSAIARRVFSDEKERLKLEGLIHPLVAEMRRREMEKLATDPQVLAFVWDTPLLLEAGLRDQCDAVVYVDAPADVRLARVRQSRHWDEAELLRRQNLQWPLDKKRKMSDDVIVNAADEAATRGQVRAVLSRILARTTQKPGPGQ